MVKSSWKPGQNNQHIVVIRAQSLNGTSQFCVIIEGNTVKVNTPDLKHQVIQAPKTCFL